MVLSPNSKWTNRNELNNNSISISYKKNGKINKTGILTIHHK